MSFSRVVNLGPHAAACLYDVDASGVRTEAEARRLLEDTRQRVRIGREQRPDCAHYVNVLAGEALPDPVRNVLFPALGSGDGIDSVAVLDASRPGPGADSASTHGAEVWAAEHARAVRLGADWQRIALAMEEDRPLEGVVVAVSEEAYRVGVGEVVGDLWRPLERELAVGERVTVRVVLLNLTRGLVGFAAR